MDRKEHGSQTAKNGFKNENDIINKFNNWKADVEACLWLKIMGYKMEEIEFVKAVKVHGYKTDVQAQVTIKLKEAIDVQNLQVKLVSNKKGFNQIDKRWVDTYANLWNMPANISLLFKKYCGEVLPTTKVRDKRRMFVNEFEPNEQIELLYWLNENKQLLINDILKGRGQFAAEWMLVAQKTSTNARWVLQPINVCINHYSKGETLITKQGNIRVGKVGVQRKGGDGGRKTAQMLQFKIDPTDMFDV
ncbi:MAG TPA: hypothetical protein PLW32_08130 [Chitinophagaceae bacterium]|jgi:hypothetical protein|nr:hypothetical protein [Chitinophagaceae bacterium]MBP9739808.1 hypothetical protein [Chitinophagaceae bacterium]HPH23833.1 hypothetical protein [Chitinophagaceae bacterium]